MGAVTSLLVIYVLTLNEIKFKMVTIVHAHHFKAARK